MIRTPSPSLVPPSAPAPPLPHIPWTLATHTDPRFLHACATPSAWLSSAELAHLDRLTVLKRRRDWLLGRWTAKGLVLAHLHRSLQATPHPTDLSIEAGDDGAPRLHHPGPPLSVSISHSHGIALCAIADDGVDVGVDLERVEPRTETFVHDFFTPAEVAWIHEGPVRERDRRATTLWSAKEAALKVLHIGLTVDTRSVHCSAEERGSGWSILRYSALGEGLGGWWREWEGYVVCLAVGHAGGAGRAHSAGG